MCIRDSSKIVEVKNTGGQDAWVRVSVNKAIELAEGVEDEVNLSLISFDLNTDYWTCLLYTSRCV